MIQTPIKLPSPNPKIIQRDSISSFTSSLFQFGFAVTLGSVGCFDVPYFGAVRAEISFLGSETRHDATCFIDALSAQWEVNQRVSGESLQSVFLCLTVDRPTNKAAPAPA
jgi:hypothetical protein